MKKLIMLLGLASIGFNCFASDGFSCAESAKSHAEACYSSCFANTDGGEAEKSLYCYQQSLEVYNQMIRTNCRQPVPCHY